MSNMSELAALTKNVLANLSDISVRQQDHVIYDKLEQGSAITFDLLREDEVHVLQAFLSSETIFPLHNHLASAETMILYKGQVTLICDEPGCETIRQDMRIGAPYYLPEGMKHLLHSKKDSWVIATLIPPDSGMTK